MVRAMKPIKPMKPKKSKPPKGPKSNKSRGKARAIMQLKDARGRFTNHMVAAGKNPPIRYHRSPPSGMRKIKYSIGMGTPVNTGYLMEFIYGEKQVYPQVGGWKHDQRPLLFVYGDDGFRILEGINTNYLSESYMLKMKKIMDRFPGVDQDSIYNTTKRTAPYAIKKGYRKYIRTSFRDVYIYVYEDEFAREIDKIAKQNAKGSKLKSVANTINDNVEND